MIQPLRSSTSHDAKRPISSSSAAVASAGCSGSSAAVSRRESLRMPRRACSSSTVPAPLRPPELTTAIARTSPAGAGSWPCCPTPSTPELPPWHHRVADRNVPRTGFIVPPCEPSPSRRAFRQCRGEATCPRSVSPSSRVAAIWSAGELQRGTVPDRVGQIGGGRDKKVADDVRPTLHGNRDLLVEREVGTVDVDGMAVAGPRAGGLPHCPRYIHRYEPVRRSRFVPCSDCLTPVPEWKRSDWAIDALPEHDPARDPGERDVLGR